MLSNNEGKLDFGVGLDNLQLTVHSLLVEVSKCAKLVRYSLGRAAHLSGHWRVGLI